MATLSRRTVLGAAAVTGAGLGLLSGCGGEPAGPPAMGWWDAQESGEEAKERTFAEFAKTKGGVPVEYTHVSAAKYPQSLQLAKQAGELPEVHVNVGLELPLPQLVRDGWIAPLDLDDAALKRLDGWLYEGIHQLDGKVYTFPIYNHRQYMTVNWFNRSYVIKAGLDPDAPPRSYDEFRAAAQAVKRSADGYHAFAWCVGMPIRLGIEVDQLAQAGGFEGSGGVLYRTGEYAYHSEPYLRAIEFLLSLQTDELLTPGSRSWSDDVARGRWNAGVAAYFFSGPWTAGSTLKSDQRWAEDLGVGPILTPETGSSAATYSEPMGGTYFVTPGSRYEKEASRLLGEYFTTFDYCVDVADSMLQPPRELKAVAKSRAHPAYHRLMDYYAEQAFLGPAAILANPDVAQVDAELRPLKPALGDIIQGAFTGDIPDYRAALKDLSDRATAERERAIDAARKGGAEVDVTDFAFPDWKPHEDYDADRYQDR